MKTRVMSARALSLLLAASLLALPAPARAEPWFGFGDARLEDRYADGDLDADDLAARPGLSRRASASGREARAGTYLSLVSFYGDDGGARTWGLMAVVGLPLDRVAEGPRRAGRAPRATGFLGDDASPSAPAQSAAPATSAASPTPSPGQRPAAALLARGAVRAAWRAAGIDADDDRIDAMITRARASAALPEARFRVLRLVDEDQHTTTTATDPLSSLYDGAGSKLWLEGRLTWRFDRLLYADDEPTIERVRLERQEARARLAGRVLELIFTWARAAADVASAPLGSRAELDARLRWWEAEIALDVVTAGWFSRQSGVTPP